MSNAAYHRARAKLCSEMARHLKSEDDLRAVMEAGARHLKEAQQLEKSPCMSHPAVHANKITDLAKCKIIVRTYEKDGSESSVRTLATYWDQSAAVAYVRQLIRIHKPLAGYNPDENYW